MDDRKTRLRKQKSTVTIVLSGAALLLFGSSFFIKNEETQRLFRVMGFGFLLATILFRVFKNEFGYKPSREEIEEKMFGKNK